MLLTPVAAPQTTPLRGATTAAPSPAAVEAPELLLNASVALPRLLDAVRGAQHVINISLYGWLDSGSGAQLARAIEQKAREGVEVNVMMDARGSFVIPIPCCAATICASASGALNGTPVVRTSPSRAQSGIP